MFSSFATSWTAIVITSDRMFVQLSAGDNQSGRTRVDGGHDLNSSDAKIIKDYILTKTVLFTLSSSESDLRALLVWTILTLKVFLMETNVYVLPSTAASDIIWGESQPSGLLADIDLSPGMTTSLNALPQNSQGMQDCRMGRCDKHT